MILLEFYSYELHLPTVWTPEELRALRVQMILFETCPGEILLECVLELASVNILTTAKLGAQPK